MALKIKEHGCNFFFTCQHLLNQIRFTCYLKFHDLHPFWPPQGQMGLSSDQPWYSWMNVGNDLYHLCNLKHSWGGCSILLEWLLIENDNYGQMITYYGTVLILTLHNQNKQDSRDSSPKPSSDLLDSLCPNCSEHLSQASQPSTSAMLKNAQQCLSMLSNAKKFSTMLSNAQWC